MPTVERGLWLAAFCSIAIAGRQALDQIDVGLLHELQELPGVGRERLDVAPLAFGIERVEGERALARARKPGDDDERVARQIELRFLRLWVRAPRMRMLSAKPNSPNFPGEKMKLATIARFAFPPTPSLRRVTFL